MADHAAAFRAVFKHDLVGDEGLDGCQTYGRTKQEAADRIEEALAAWFDCEPNEFALTHG